MKLLKAMRQRENFSALEQNVIGYMLDHPKDIERLSIRDLAEKTYASTATVLRLCRKLGTDGFPAFKIKFASEISRARSFELPPEEWLITGEDDPAAIVNKLANLEIEAIEETKNEIGSKRKRG